MPRRSAVFDKMKALHVPSFQDKKDVYAMVDVLNELLEKNESTAKVRYPLHRVSIIFVSFFPCRYGSIKTRLRLVLIGIVKLAVV